VKLKACDTLVSQRRTRASRLPLRSLWSKRFSLEKVWLWTETVVGIVYRSTWAHSAVCVSSNTDNFSGAFLRWIGIVAMFFCNFSFNFYIAKACNYGMLNLSATIFCDGLIFDSLITPSYFRQSSICRFARHFDITTMYSNGATAISQHSALQLGNSANCKIESLADWSEKLLSIISYHVYVCDCNV